MKILIGLPFLKVNSGNYIARAFDLKREFLYQWTVNWRFVPEEHFLSKRFATSLLVGNGTLLLVFAATRWLKPSRRSLLQALRMAFADIPDTEQYQISNNTSPRFILTTFLSANAIGMLFARSLHYQFYAWLAWTTPFLLWQAKLHWTVIYLIYGMQEWAWNVYPSTASSSAVVVGCLIVAVAGVWYGTANDDEMKSIPEERLPLD